MVEDNPKKMKVGDLRAALALRGLSTEGLKADLLTRLQARLDEEEFGMVDAPVAVVSKDETPASKEDDPEDEEPEEEAPKEGTPKEETTKVDPSNPAPEAPKDEKKVEGTADDRKMEEAAPADDKPKVSIKITKEMTFEEKKALRAKKFGLPVPMEQRKKARAERFGLDSKKDGKADRKDVNNGNKRGKEVDKKEVQSPIKKRKKDEKKEEPLLPKDEIQKRLKRLEDFGKSDPAYLEKKDKLKAMLRKHRFG